MDLRLLGEMSRSPFYVAWPAPAKPRVDGSSVKGYSLKVTHYRHGPGVDSRAVPAIGANASCIILLGVPTIRKRDPMFMAQTLGG